MQPEYCIILILYLCVFVHHGVAANFSEIPCNISAVRGSLYRKGEGLAMAAINFGKELRL